MKIVYIHQYFKTPEDGGGLRSYYVSQAMHKAGHEVEVISAHNASGYKKVNLNGVIVHYLPIPYDNTFGFWYRSTSFTWFMIRAFFLALKIKNVHLFYISSTPLTVGLIGIAIKKIRRIPYVFEVRDLWPEAPIQIKYLQNPLLIHLAYYLEKKIYTHAKHIIGLSPGMVEGIKSKTNTPTSMVPNMCDCDYFKASYPVSNNPIHIVYIGAIGQTNALDSFALIANYAALHFPGQYSFSMAGKGKEERYVQQLNHAKNIVFKGLLCKEDVKHLLEEAHVSYISFGPEPVLQTNSPNKFFDSIAAGKCCVINVEGWIKDLIEKNKIGFYHDRNQPEMFFNQLEALKNDFSSISIRARCLAEVVFNKDLLSNNIISIITTK